MFFLDHNFVYGVHWILNQNNLKNQKLKFFQFCKAATPFTVIYVRISAMIKEKLQLCSSYVCTVITNLIMRACNLSKLQSWHYRRSSTKPQIWQHVLCKMHRSLFYWCEKSIILFVQLEIHSMERGICPIATLYSLAAAFQRLTLLWACSQFCLWIKTVGCHDNRNLQGRNLHDTIA